MNSMNREKSRLKSDSRGGRSWFKGLLGFILAAGTGVVFFGTQVLAPIFCLVTMFGWPSDGETKSHWCAENFPSNTTACLQEYPAYESSADETSWDTARRIGQKKLVRLIREKLKERYPQPGGFQRSESWEGRDKEVVEEVEEDRRQEYPPETEEVVQMQEIVQIQDNPNRKLPEDPAAEKGVKHALPIHDGGEITNTANIRVGWIDKSANDVWYELDQGFMFMLQEGARDFTFRGIPAGALRVKYPKGGGFEYKTPNSHWWFLSFKTPHQEYWLIAIRKDLVPRGAPVRFMKEILTTTEGETTRTRFRQEVGKRTLLNGPVYRTMPGHQSNIFTGTNEYGDMVEYAFSYPHIEKLGKMIIYLHKGDMKQHKPKSSKRSVKRPVESGLTAEFGRFLRSRNNMSR